MSTPTTVSLNTEANRKATIAAGAVAAVGLGLLALAYFRDWGFLAWFWSGVVAFGGLAGLFGLLKGGGHAQAPCPHCSAQLRFIHPETARTIQCSKCSAWSTGTKTMAPVSNDHINPEAVFNVPFPDGGVSWPTTDDGTPCCPVCERAATRQVEVTFSTGDIAALVLPVSIRTTNSLQVPACAEHDDGASLQPSEDGEVELAFRSYAYMRRFVATNRSLATP
ncbi:hypothetical protein [Enhygromyxa salina]|uniref:Uncharacterized protein n=1 Tax=Enhygromyxa salina TaxID=215803 RepID=A0A2S9YC67_9BACT|nr:hypothetical protein [Enhygromyxa salina]PRQ02707.1 hypothetical protein ENSA7_55360 [Enhygromyxa salina]